MKRLLSIAILMICLLAKLNAQTRFEPGYFIDNDGKRVNCLIKDVNWKATPNKFSYITAEGESIRTKKISEVQGFGLDNGTTFTKFILKVDQSSADPNKYSTGPEPEYAIDTLLLKLIVDSHVKLYEYSNGSNKKFFFQKVDGEVKELVRKYYLYGGGAKSNELFRQQLKNELSCGEKIDKQIARVRYFRKEMVRYFINYNQCMGYEAYSQYDTPKTEQKGAKSITLRAGMMAAEFETDFLPDDTYDADFGRQFAPRLAVELELLIPETSQKLALLAELYYTSYSSEVELTGVQTDRAAIDYRTTGLAVGLRYYLKLSPKSRLFVNTSFMMTNNYDSEVIFESLPNPLKIKTSFEGNWGLGYSYNDKVFLELKQNLTNDFLKEQTNIISKFRSQALIIGYRF